MDGNQQLKDSKEVNQTRLTIGIVSIEWTGFAAIRSRSYLLHLFRHYFNPVRIVWLWLFLVCTGYCIVVKESSSNTARSRKDKLS
jgi:hypothetical protein